LGGVGTRTHGTVAVTWRTNMTYDLDELRRLEREATRAPWNIEGVIITMHDDEQQPHDEAFVVALRNAAGDGMLERLAKLEEQWAVERDAKRMFANALLNLVEAGRSIAMQQPSACAENVAQVDAWARFYRLLNEAPVSFASDLDAAIRSTRRRTGDE
jgi:hypothetical protein